MAPKLSGVTLYNNWKWKWMQDGPTSRQRGFDRPQLLSYLAHRPHKQAGLTQRSPPPHIPPGTKPHNNKQLALLSLLELCYSKEFWQVPHFGAGQERIGSVNPWSGGTREAWW